MIISAVIDPLAFESGCFELPDYRKEANLFLKGINTNGLLLVDPEANLQQQMINKIKNLPSKYSQDLLIRLEELLKNKRKKIIRSHPSCGVIRTNDILELVWSVFEKCEADGLISNEDRLAQLRANGRIHSGTIALYNYSESYLENERNRYLTDLPPIDTLDLKDVNKLFFQVVKFSRWLRFYDKQIGKGQNISNFCKGIEHILNLWERHGHFASRGDIDFVEIITCQCERIRQEESNHAKESKRIRNLEAYKKVVDSLLKPLKYRFPWRIELKIKDEGDISFHARHLQTQNAIILVDAGFDLFIPRSNPKKFKRNIIKIDNGSFQHLQEYRNLPDSQF